MPKHTCVPQNYNKQNIEAEAHLTEAAGIHQQ